MGQHRQRSRRSPLSSWLATRSNSPGFGKFSTVARPAREGRNPQTGESLQIAAKTSALPSAGFIANVPRFILLDDDESRADRPDDCPAGEFQPLHLGNHRRAAHSGVLPALSQAALRNRSLDLLRVESGGRVRGATRTEYQAGPHHEGQSQGTEMPPKRWHQASFSMSKDAFELGCVPPIGVARPTAALEV
jgi:hypothetical protein